MCKGLNSATNTWKGVKKGLPEGLDLKVATLREDWAPQSALREDKAPGTPTVECTGENKLRAGEGGERRAGERQTTLRGAPTYRWRLPEGREEARQRGEVKTSLLRPRRLHLSLSHAGEEMIRRKGRGGREDLVTTLSHREVEEWAVRGCGELMNRGWLPP